MNETTETDDLTADEAARLLNVSVPYLLRLVADGVLPAYTVGDGYRVRPQDVMAYKQDVTAKRHAALAELTALNQELGLYDDPMKGADRS